VAGRGAGTRHGGGTGTGETGTVLAAEDGSLTWRAWTEHAGRPLPLKRIAGWLAGTEHARGHLSLGVTATRLAWARHAW
jgi:hypothetical protein